MDMLKILAKEQSSGELQDEIENLNEEKENSMTYCQFKNDNILEKILNNPGFRHLAENIFDNLNFWLFVKRSTNHPKKYWNI